jgi:hypothetical protein
MTSMASKTLVSSGMHVAGTPRAYFAYVDDASMAEMRKHSGMLLVAALMASCHRRQRRRARVGKEAG